MAVATSHHSLLVELIALPHPMNQSAPTNFVLYRILGNCLPPRHRSNEVLENLQFTLRHEPELKRCEKRWFLNRIVDPALERQYIDLIESAGHAWVRLPFDLEEYATRLIDGSDMPLALLPRLARVQEPSEAMATRGLEWIYRHKSLYAVSVNLARNLALAEGRRTASWTLPWDGSCFVTESGWSQLLRLADTNEQAMHLIVPMVRISANEDLLDDQFVPEEFDEPQIAFKSGSQVEFDNSLRYGNMNKAELLKILGVPGPWQDWTLSPWESPRERTTPERDRFVVGGWVARLAAYPGEERATQSLDRWKSRLLGVTAHCRRIDERIVKRRLEQEPLAFLDEAVVEAAAKARGGALFELVTHRARLALNSPIPTILDKQFQPPSGDRRDYVSLSPYFHVTANGFELRDGERHPESELTGEASRMFDRSALEAFIRRTITTALAGRLTGDRACFEFAAELLRTWFVRERTRMNPHMRFAQIIPREPIKGHPWGIVDFRNFWCLLDAIRLVRRTGLLPDQDLDDIKLWFSEFLRDLLDRSSRDQINNLGTWFDLTVASIAAFTGEVDLAARTLSEATLRLTEQLSPFSVPCHEINRSRPLHYCLFNLEAWIGLAWLGRTLGVDLWKYQASMNRSLAMAARFVTVNRTCFDDYREDPVAHDQRVAAVVRCVPQHAADYHRLADLGLPPAPLVLINPSFGLPPYWPVLRVGG